MRTRATIAATTGAAAFSTAGLLGQTGSLTLARLSLLGAALACAAIYDLNQRRILNRVVLPASAGCAALALAAGARLDLLAGLALVGALLIASLLRPRALGMGDVKLALLLVLGLDGDALRALAVGLALAALAALTLLARQGSSAWRASLPLAPFLAAGALVSLLVWTVG
jgi:leader peptidase (prepilin peptidase) / N-methyltransferase